VKFLQMMIKLLGASADRGKSVRLMHLKEILNNIGNQIACASGFCCAKIFENRMSETRGPGLAVVLVAPRTGAPRALLERTSLDVVDQGESRSARRSKVVDQSKHLALEV
jgi:hypothetical protein